MNQTEIKKQKKTSAKLNNWQKSIQRSRRWSYVIFVLAIISFFVYYLNDTNSFLHHINPYKPFLYLSILLLVAGILFFMPIDNYIFDNKEYELSENTYGFIERLRLRAIVFNNLSVLVFIVTVFVIVCSFYLLIRSDTAADTNPAQLNYSKLTAQVGSVVILIFLVQILFRVFKYLLRVAAFYNGKADAIELSELDPKYKLDTVLDSFAPTNYDISDVESPNLFPKP